MASFRGSATSGTAATTYDASGNTQNLTWTPEDRLASATTGAGTSTCAYGTAGNRLLRKDPGKTTLHLGSTELALDTTTNTDTGTRYYTTPGGHGLVRTSDCPGRLDRWSAASSAAPGTGPPDSPTSEPANTTPSSAGSSP
ncbi:hypothetical protein OG594_18285 [Streptomyces sp. NBC_01214]|uniref:hypothetical protein n=1 Tax=Streptomyces sp. NBC_01214 TaxID=2903777 RepID=UPI00225B691C|nr:hypothetical protein [Streptomyces sp. NBC_01214]MCX4803575.1 hypothetical protein [Streptomyces sp. NBC_01214]